MQNTLIQPMHPYWAHPKGCHSQATTQITLQHWLSFAPSVAPAFVAGFPATLCPLFLFSEVIMELLHPLVPVPVPVPVHDLDPNQTRTPNLDPKHMEPKHMEPNQTSTPTKGVWNGMPQTWTPTKPGPQTWAPTKPEPQIWTPTRPGPKTWTPTKPGPQLHGAQPNLGLNQTWTPKPNLDPKPGTQPNLGVE